MKRRTATLILATAIGGVCFALSFSVVAEPRPMLPQRDNTAIPPLKEVITTADHIIVGQAFYSPGKLVMAGASFNLDEENHTLLLDLLRKTSRFDAAPPKDKADYTFSVDQYQGRMWAGVREPAIYEYHSATGLLGRQLYEASGKQEWCVVSDVFQKAFLKRAALALEKERKARGKTSSFP